MLVPSVSIQNRHGVSMLIDEEDLGLLTQHKDGHWCFALDSTGYAILRHKKSIGGNGQSIPFHRLIMKASIDLGVNHVNKNILDNRKENLQICTKHGYIPKVVGFGCSRFRGVCRNGKNWRATLNHKYVAINLGTFDTEIEAALAYDTAIKKLKTKKQDRKVCVLNFPDEVPSA